MSFLYKSVFITGASRGLGLEFVKQMVKLSPRPEVIIACCRNPDSATVLQDIAKENPSCVKILKLDIDKDEEIDPVVQETKGIVGEKGLNLLIHNAGLNEKSSGQGIFSETREIMQKHFNCNVTSPIILTQKMSPLLTQAVSKGSVNPSVVLISSIMGSQELTHQHGYGLSYHYKCSKAAATMAGIMMYKELSSSGILVYSMHPGWVQTDMGGSGADLTPEHSIASMLKVMSGADESLAGKLVDYSGKILPY